MSRDDIIRMAREADEGFETDTFHEESLVGMDAIERFAHLVYEATFRDARCAGNPCFAYCEKCKRNVKNSPVNPDAMRQCYIGPWIMEDEKCPSFVEMKEE